MTSCHHLLDIFQTTLKYLSIIIDFLTHRFVLKTLIDKPWIKIILCWVIVIKCMRRLKSATIFIWESGDIYRRFLVHAHDNLSLVIPNNKTIEHWQLWVLFIAVIYTNKFNQYYVLMNLDDLNPFLLQKQSFLILKNTPFY